MYVCVYVCMYVCMYVYIYNDINDIHDTLRQEVYPLSLGIAQLDPPEKT